MEDVAAMMAMLAAYENFLRPKIGNSRRKPSRSD
jgi:hypothetical protein